jgi:hypothetical protein
VPERVRASNGAIRNPNEARVIGYNRLMKPRYVVAGIFAMGALGAGAACGSASPVAGDCAKEGGCQTASVGAAAGGGGGGGAGPSHEAVPCASAAECTSGRCVDGFCCNAPCEGTCQACNLPGLEGVCATYPALSDPEGECVSGACAGAAICAGEVVWATAFGTSGSDRIASAAGDGSENTIVGGSFIGPIEIGATTLSSMGGRDFYVAKLGPNGLPAWAKRFGSDEDQLVRGIAVDGQDNIIVAGHFHGSFFMGAFELASAGSRDLFVAKLDPGGQPLWAKRFGGVDYDQVLHVAARGDGTIALACTFRDTISFGDLVPLESAGENDVCLVVLDGDGEPLWAQQFGDEANNHISFGEGGPPTRVVFDDSGAVVLAASLTGTIDFGHGPLPSVGGLADIFLAKFSVAGELSWAKHYGTQNSDFVAGVATSSSGRIAIAGSFEGTLTADAKNVTSAGGSDALVMVHDAAGAVSWVGAYGDVTTQAASAVAFRGEDPIVVGAFEGAIDFGLGALGSAGSSDVFVVRFDEAGKALWQRRFGTEKAERADGVVSWGNLLTVWGTFEWTLDLGFGEFQSKGMLDVFAAKLTN